jgi:hypothetical protein
MLRGAHWHSWSRHERIYVGEGKVKHTSYHQEIALYTLHWNIVAFNCTDTQPSWLENIVKLEPYIQLFYK